MGGGIDCPNRAEGGAVGTAEPPAEEGTEADQRAPVSYTHLRAHETVLDLVCRLLLEKKKTKRRL